MFPCLGRPDVVGHTLVAPVGGHGVLDVGHLRLGGGVEVDVGQLLAEEAVDRDGAGGRGRCHSVGLALVGEVGLLVVQDILVLGLAGRVEVGAHLVVEEAVDGCEGARRVGSEDGINGLARRDVCVGTTGGQDEVTPPDEVVSGVGSRDDLSAAGAGIDCLGRGTDDGAARARRVGQGVGARQIKGKRRADRVVLRDVGEGAAGDRANRGPVHEHVFDVVAGVGGDGEGDGSPSGHRLDGARRDGAVGACGRSDGVGDGRDHSGLPRVESHVEHGHELAGRELVPGSRRMRVAGWELQVV